MSNHIDRFHAAMLVVAGHGNIKQRLTGAFEEHLSLIEDEELPVADREEFAELKSLVRELMEGAVELSVPITVSVGVGPNWLEVK